MTFSESLPFEKELLETGACVFHIKNNPEKNELAFREEFKRILSNGYDVIHIATSYWKNTIIEEMAKEAGIKKIIIHCHSAGINAKNINDQSAIELHKRIRDTINSNVATDFVACSRLAADWLYGNVIPQKEIRIIYNGIDTKRFRYNSLLRQDVRKKFGIENCFVLGFVGRLEPVKNVVFLIELMEKLVKENKNIRLLIVGDGSQRIFLQELVEKKLLEDYILFIGNVTDVEKYYQAFDVFLIPSFFEGFSLVLLEAQCSGVKCIISENVPEEAVVTDLVSRVSLDNKKLWMQTALFFSKGYGRRDYSDVISKAGFDSSSLAKNIENLYLEV